MTGTQNSLSETLVCVHTHTCIYIIIQETVFEIVDKSQSIKSSAARRAFPPVATAGESMGWGGGCWTPSHESGALEEGGKGE